MTKSLLGLPEDGYVASGGAAREGVGRPVWNDAKFRYEGDITLAALARDFDKRFRASGKSRRRE